MVKEDFPLIFLFFIYWGEEFVDEASTTIFVCFLLQNIGNSTNGFLAVILKKGSKKHSQKSKGVGVRVI